MATAALGRRVGAAVKEAAAKEGWGWFTPHMAATSRAILDRIPMVDFTLEIRDSRIPFSSAYEYGCRFPSSSKRMIVLNKIDLADRAQTLKWIKHFEEHNCICYGVNSHNKDNIKEARIRELKVGQSNYTATVMLAGIPNVGKSAIANSLHQIGRISAAEKGKLKHAVVTPLPGETKDISSFKIASHPNIYVLDTPGVLAPEIFDIEMGSKLALTGAVQDWLTGECELAKYFLSILNSSDEYKRWEKLNTKEDDRLSMNHEDKVLSSSNSDKRRRKQYSTDHTQDFIVRAVRRTLFETVLSFTGNMENEEEMVGLIKAQLMALHEAFRLPLDSGEDGHKRVATKLLNLYRTGRLGHYTLDPVPVTAQESII
ncbi:P-loop containing nucleoside triphosphate hydrolases superfamily protein isoform X2 [Tasmannia lanceolata]|uniref:P-loop containing nucleoside triphosphate hydrolases superfamily protein isoform X2 n=1 Tax=Tasmannia lanceolata TaxID=3420 RepID=UPI0040636D91